MEKHWYELPILAILMFTSVAYFALGTVDLYIDPKNITFSEKMPMEGDAVTITALVSNKGTEDITQDIEIRFVEGNPSEGGLQIGTDAVLLGLKAGALGKTQVKWRAPGGETKIYVTVDPNNMVKESNENNNTAIRAIMGKKWTGPKVTNDQIKESIKKGVEWLKSQQGEFYVTCPNGHDNFMYSAMAYGKCVICGASLENIEPKRASDETTPGGWLAEIGPGMTSLVVAALLNAGVPVSDPTIVKGLDHLFNKTSVPWKEWTDAYDYAVFLLALTSTGDKEKYMEAVDFATKKLIKFQTNDGGWGYGGMGADVAHLHYVILGLYAAKQWGVDIPVETWTKVVAWLTGLQRPDGGWNYSGGDIGPFAVDSYGSMTATAIMGLKAAGVSPDNESVKRGIEWLKKHYTITRNPGSFYWHYYYLLAVQRAMDMPPRQEKIGEHDWFNEMASFLVSKQKKDGSWVADTPIYTAGTAGQISTEVVAWGKDRGDIMTTAFAIMFLTRSLPQSAIPDLGFTQQGIYFSKTDVKEEEEVAIKASIANFTKIDLEKVNVNFYDGNPNSAGVLIGASEIAPFAGDEVKEVSITWEAKGSGEHKIYAVIDPSNAIQEVSKYNNTVFGLVNVVGGTVPAIPGIVQIGDGVYKLGKIDLDLNKKTITMYGKINMTAGLIEVLACTRIGKLHESVLVIDVEPIHLQTALILLGLEFQEGARYQGDPLTPKGDKVTIWVEWSIDGVTKRHRAEDLVFDRVKQKSMEHIDWVFTGSRMNNGIFMSQATGTLISTYRDPDTIIDNPLPGGADDTVYIVNSQIVPPKGTGVKVIITPAKSSSG